MKDLGVNRTRIIVAHRLSTIMHVDQVVVMKDGCKVEQGTINNLLRKPNGMFRAMWERQQRKDKTDEDGSVEDMHERHDLSEDEARLEDERERRDEDRRYGVWEGPRHG